MSLDSQKFSSKVEALLNSPDFMLEASFSGWEVTASPAYVWQAIDICRKHRRDFPDWVLDYLAACARRLLSNEARCSTDLRKVLPWALGFPAKRGPGRPLDPDPAKADRLLFAVKFAIEIENGKKPAAAIKDACSAFDARVADSVDDKTLRRWLREEFDLTRTPRSATEWKDAARAKFGAFISLTETRFREILP
jgi:hypothetical protein